MLVIGFSAFICSLACLLLYLNTEKSDLEKKGIRKDLETAH